MKKAFSLLLLTTTAIALCAQPSMVKISEVLFNPRDKGADYIELYNAGKQSVPLADLYLARWKNNVIDKLFPVNSDQVIAPKEYVVITTDAADIMSRYTVKYMSRLVEVAAMPAYNNDTGSVVLCTADTTLIERFDYSEKMHSRLLRDVEGVALERRSFDRPASEPSNWFSASSVAGYGTPTYQNSQSHEFVFLENEFAVSADIFSPDGDGYQDLIDITYQLKNDNLSASISIFDAHGRLVRHLLRNASLGTSGALVWDGTDDNDARCRRGNYVLHIDAYDAQGSRQTMKKTITLIIK